METALQAAPDRRADELADLMDDVSGARAGSSKQEDITLRPLHLAREFCHALRLARQVNGWRRVRSVAIPFPVPNQRALLV